MKQMICPSYLNVICVHFLAKYVVRDLSLYIIALLNCNWFSLLRMILCSVIKKYFINPSRLMIYERTKNVLSFQFRFHSSLRFIRLLFSLRARDLSFAINSKSKSYKNNSFLGDTKYSHRDHSFSFSLFYLCLLLLTLLLPFQKGLTAPQVSIVWGNWR